MTQNKTPQPLSYTEQRIVTFALLHGQTHAALEFNMTPKQIKSLVERAVPAMKNKGSP